MNVSPRTLFFSFDGRINRATYWTRAFPVFLTFGLFAVSVRVLEFRAFGTQGVVSLVLSVGAFWPVLAVAVKRLHDRGRSAWYLLAFLIPILGPIWLLVEMLALPGAQGANRFGDAPRDKGLKRRWIVPFVVAGIAALCALLAWTFFWPGAAITRALNANGYELIRMEAPVSGPVQLPPGNTLILMQVDGAAKVGDVEISQCTQIDSPTMPNAQACRLEGPFSHILIGSPFAGTPAFSVEVAEGRAIVVLSVDFLGPDAPHAAGSWLIEELNRP